jgi:nitroreductase
MHRGEGSTDWSPRTGSESPAEGARVNRLSAREVSMGTTTDRREFVKLSAVVGAPLALGLPPRPALGDRSAAQDDPSFFDVVRTRRSVRSFESTPVPEDHLHQILDAARMAPTSGNQQPWQFLVVRDPELIGQMMERCVEMSLEYRRSRGATVTPEMEASVREGLGGYFSAPAYIVVLTDNDSRYPTYNHWDGPLAAGYLMLAARALGYGTVFITDAIPDQVTKEVLEIPDRYTRVCITPLGVPMAWPDSPEKRALEEFVVYDRF